MTLLAKYMINLLLWKWKHKAGRYTLVKQTDNQIKEAISPERDSLFYFRTGFPRTHIFMIKGTPGISDYRG